MLYTQELRQSSFEKVQHKHSHFCRELRSLYQGTSTPLYCQIQPDARAGMVATQVDSRYAHTDSLVEWLRENHHHKKHNWKPTYGASPRTTCWDDAILARRSTACIWDSRLAADAGITAASDYLQKGVRVPPLRRTLEARSRPPTEDYSAHSGGEFSGKRHTWQTITGVPSPRRFVGIGSEICASPRQLAGSRAGLPREDSARANRTASTRTSSARSTSSSHASHGSTHSQTVISLVTRQPDPSTMTMRECYATPKAPRIRPPPLHTE